MARSKKRDDTVVRVYQFGARPVGELPPQFWNTAKQMQFVWNELVQMRDELAAKFTDLGIDTAEHKNERVAHWRQFDRSWRDYLKSEAATERLGNDEREFLSAKFEAADKAAKKAKTGLRRQFVLDRINFRHRLSSGGTPLDKFKEQRGNKFSFRFPAPEAYLDHTKSSRRARVGSGTFGVSRNRRPVFAFPFSAVIHRKIPEQAVIKSVSWIGKRLKNSGYSRRRLPPTERDWNWSTNIVVEIPAAVASAADPTAPRRIAALDLGWRKLDEDFLRIGTILDTDDNYLEIRSPINYLSRAARDGKLAAGLREIIELDEQKGKLVQATKDRLSAYQIDDLTLMREGGLFRLAEILAETGENPAALEIVTKFKAIFLPLAERRARSFDRLLKYRNWLYQNIAAWLAENYDALIWEGELNLKRMAESRRKLGAGETAPERSRELARRQAAKYRDFAALYNFRECLKKAFEKKGKSIINGATRFTSRTCSECGAVAEESVGIEFVCPNNHSFDRNFNGARNLLNQLKDNPAGGSITAGLRRGSDDLQIPSRPNRDLSRILKKMPLPDNYAKIAGRRP